MKVKKSNTKKVKTIDDLPINKKFRTIDQLNAESARIQKEAEEDAVIEKQLQDIEKMEKLQREKILLAHAKSDGRSHKERIKAAEGVLDLAKTDGRVDICITHLGIFYTVAKAIYWFPSNNGRAIAAEGISRRSEKDHMVQDIGDKIAVGRAKKSLLTKIVMMKQVHNAYMA